MALNLIIYLFAHSLCASFGLNTEDTKQYSTRSDEQRHLAAAFGNFRRSRGRFWELTGLNKYQEYHEYRRTRSTTSTGVPRVHEYNKYHEYHEYHENHEYRVPVGTSGSVGSY